MYEGGPSQAKNFKFYSYSDLAGEPRRTFRNMLVFPETPLKELKTESWGGGGGGETTVDSRRICRIVSARKQITQRGVQ